MAHVFQEISMNPCLQKDDIEILTVFLKPLIDDIYIVVTVVIEDWNILHSLDPRWQ